MDYEIGLKEIDPQPMVSIRMKCKPAEVGPILAEILPEVFAYLREQGVKPSGPPFTRYLGYSEDNVELEGGFPVSKPLPGEGRIESGKLPGGTVAFTMHVGPYERLPEAHDALDIWINDNGKTSAGPQWECYWTDPGEEPNPSKRKTELLWPVK